MPWKHTLGLAVVVVAVLFVLHTFAPSQLKQYLGIA
jgi:hypothetical protein